MNTRLVTRLAVVVACAGLFAAAACASTPDTKRYTFIGEAEAPLAPSVAEYRAGPDNYLGKRCSSLDCHGQIGRPLRIFSKNGLRAFDASPPGGFPYISGRTGLADEEVLLNYEGVIGLEPEVLSQVYASGGEGLNRLILLRKPLGLERHKGGQLMNNEADEGYLCLASWISGNGLDQISCDNAAKIP